MAEFIDNMKGDETKLSRVISYLEMLSQLFEDEVVPTMVFDGDTDRVIEELAELIKWLQKTN